MYKHILKRKLKDYYKSHPRENCYLNLKDIHTILILFDTITYEEADTFAEKLKKLGKNITAYAYKNKKDIYSYSKSPYRIITTKEVDVLFDNKIEDIVREVEAQKFDAVIDLTIRRNLPLEYLLAHSDASLKAGLKKCDPSPYDLSITTLPEIERETLKVRELAKQIIYYLHSIRSK
jgi:hypothetical protein